MRIGVLALQGAFKEHINILEQLDIEVIKVREPMDLLTLDGIILPGGESTVMGKLLIRNQLKKPLIDSIINGLPTWGTCAGMILLSNNHDHLKVMTIDVKRNAYGNQLGSFTVFKAVKGVKGGPLALPFIRAPYVTKLGVNVEILCEVENRVVAVKEGNILATSFHPEVTNDHRMHHYFIELIKNRI
jgi:5'-phosphate synthase pdxT subunit